MGAPSWPSYATWLSIGGLRLSSLVGGTERSRNRAAASSEPMRTCRNPQTSPPIFVAFRPPYVPGSGPGAKEKDSFQRGSTYENEAPQRRRGVMEGTAAAGGENRRETQRTSAGGVSRN